MNIINKIKNCFGCASQNQPALQQSENPLRTRYIPVTPAGTSAGRSTHGSGYIMQRENAPTNQTEHNPNDVQTFVQLQEALHRNQSTSTPIFDSQQEGEEVDNKSSRTGYAKTFKERNIARAQLELRQGSIDPDERVQEWLDKNVSLQPETETKSESQSQANSESEFTSSTSRESSGSIKRLADCLPKSSH